MVKCGPAGMRACSLGLVGLGFRVRDKVRVSVSVELLTFRPHLAWIAAAVNHILYKLRF